MHVKIHFKGQVLLKKSQCFVYGYCLRKGFTKGWGVQLRYNLRQITVSCICQMKKGILSQNKAVTILYKGQDL